MGSVPLLRCCEAFLDNLEEVGEMKWVLCSAKAESQLHFTMQHPVLFALLLMGYSSLQLSTTWKNQTMKSATSIAYHMDLSAWFWDGAKFRKCSSSCSNYMAITLCSRCLFVMLCRIGSFNPKIKMRYYWELTNSDNGHNGAPLCVGAH